MSNDKTMSEVLRHIGVAPHQRIATLLEGHHNPPELLAVAESLHNRQSYDYSRSEIERFFLSLVDMWSYLVDDTMTGFLERYTHTFCEDIVSGAASDDAVRAFSTVFPWIAYYKKLNDTDHTESKTPHFEQYAQEYTVLLMCYYEYLPAVINNDEDALRTNGILHNIIRGIYRHYIGSSQTPGEKNSLFFCEGLSQESLRLIFDVGYRNTEIALLCAVHAQDAWFNFSMRQPQRTTETLREFFETVDVFIANNIDLLIPMFSPDPVTQSQIDHSERWSMKMVAHDGHDVSMAFSILNLSQYQEFASMISVVPHIFDNPENIDTLHKLSFLGRIDHINIFSVVGMVNAGITGDDAIRLFDVLVSIDARLPNVNDYSGFIRALDEGVVDHETILSLYGAWKG